MPRTTFRDDAGNGAKENRDPHFSGQSYDSLRRKSMRPHKRFGSVSHHVPMPPSNSSSRHPDIPISSTVANPRRADARDQFPVQQPFEYHHGSKRPEIKIRSFVTETATKEYPGMDIGVVFRRQNELLVIDAIDSESIFAGTRLRPGMVLVSINNILAHSLTETAVETIAQCARDRVTIEACEVDPIRYPQNLPKIQPIHPTTQVPPQASSGSKSILRTSKYGTSRTGIPTGASSQQQVKNQHSNPTKVASRPNHRIVERSQAPSPGAHILTAPALAASVIGTEDQIVPSRAQYYIDQLDDKKCVKYTGPPSDGECPHEVVSTVKTSWMRRLLCCFVNKVEEY